MEKSGSGDSCSGVDLISRTPHGFDRIAPELLAQPADIDFDRIAVDFGAKLIERVFNIRFGDHGTRMAEEPFQHRPFPGSQIDRLARDADEATGKVDIEVSQPQQPTGTAAIAARRG